MKKILAGSLIMLILFMFNKNIINAGESDDKLITGFNCDTQICASYNVSRNTISEDLTALFPEELEVYLGGNDEITKLPVSWSACGESIEDTKYYYLQYSPDFGSGYTFSDDIDPLKDLPYIAVYISDEDMTGIETVSDTEKGIETCDNAVITYRYLRNNMGFNCASAAGY